MSYYVREEDGLPMLEQLQRGVGFIEACGYCVTEWGEGTQPDSVEGYATIQEGYVLGGISLDLTTHLLAPYKLKFNPLGERVQMSSNHGPVEPEKISEALDRMR